MIEGFKIDMTAEEILGHLETQIQRHRDRAARCDAKRLRLEGAEDDSSGPGDDEDDEDDEDQELAMCWPGYVDELKRRVDRHRRHEAALVFLRDHVVAHEIYRLGESDLRFLELGPRRHGGITPGVNADG